METALFDAFICSLYFQSSDVTGLQMTVLKGLPILLGEDSSEVYRTYFVRSIDLNYVNLLTNIFIMYFIAL